MNIKLEELVSILSRNGQNTDFITRKISDNSFRISYLFMENNPDFKRNNFHVLASVWFDSRVVDWKGTTDENLSIYVAFMPMGKSQYYSHHTEEKKYKNIEKLRKILNSNYPLSNDYNALIVEPTSPNNFMKERFDEKYDNDGIISGHIGYGSSFAKKWEFKNASAVAELINNFTNSFFITNYNGMLTMMFESPRFHLK